MSSPLSAHPSTAGPRRRPSTLSAGLVPALLVAGASAGALGLADAAGEHDGPSRWDPVVAADVLRLRTPALTHLAQGFTFVGGEVVVGALAIVLFVTLVVRRQLSQATVLAVGMGGSVFLTVALKLLVARPRPGAVDRLGALDTSYSFPSGHTLNTTVFVVLVVWLLWPSLRYAGHVAAVVAGAVLVVGVAASRLYLGYHWLTDVLASGLVALAWLGVVWLLRSMILRADQAAGRSQPRDSRHDENRRGRDPLPTDAQQGPRGHGVLLGHQDPVHHRR